MMARISDPVFAPWKLGKVWIRILTRTRNALLMHRCQRTTPLIDGASLCLVFYETATVCLCASLEISLGRKKIFRPNVWDDRGWIEKICVATVENVKSVEKYESNGSKSFKFRLF